MTIRRNQLCMSRPTRQLQRTKHSEAQYNNKNRQHQPNFTLVGTEQSMGSASEKYRRRRSIRRGSGRRRRGYCGARTAEFDSFPAATVDKERGCGRRVELMRSERTLGVLHPFLSQRCSKLCWPISPRCYPPPTRDSKLSQFFGSIHNFIFYIKKNNLKIFSMKLYFNNWRTKSFFFF